VRLTILHVPGCPGLPVLAGRLAELLPGYPASELDRQVVSTAEEAERAGLAGSPTLLIDGVDPFARPGQRPSLSCRLYRDEQGRAAPAPSVGQLRAALGRRAGAAGQ
jgi:hypothetical protein